MAKRQRILNFSNFYLLFLLTGVSVAAYLLKKYGYDSTLNIIAIIGLAMSGVSIVVCAGLYGFLENKYGKEEDLDPNSDTHKYFKLLSEGLLLSQGIGAVCFLVILSLFNPLYPILILVPFLLMLLYQTLKGLRNNAS
jgi:hypothetical protein